MRYLLLNDLLDYSEKIGNKEKFVKLINQYKNYLPIISELLYSKFEQDDRERFLIWFFKRLGNIDIVNKDEYNLYCEMVRKVVNQDCPIIEIGNQEYKVQDMDIQGYSFKLAAYKWVLSIHDVFYNQYEHKTFQIKKGDVIIDAGGFIGDTAVLFCNKTSNDCFIHAFELLDENIKLFEYNNKLNNIESFVKINQLALTNSSNEIIRIKQTALQGGTSIFGGEGCETSIKTITLDDYVLENKIDKVDLIKMDIEGAEIVALEGAVKTIEQFKPRLALCLYHKWDDVITIPKFLATLKVQYNYYFKWVELIHGREAVLLAEPIEG